MEAAAVRPRSAPPTTFEDGLGKRHHAVGAGGEPLEVLALRGELTAALSFEFALRERVGALAGFQHPSFARVRGVLRLEPVPSALAVVSDRVPGTRLSEVLAVAERQLLPLEINAALCLIRQLVPAVAMLHEKMPGIGHGAIAPERIVVSPNARVILVDQVLGSALEQLRFSHGRHWRELRVAVPRSADPPRFDQRTDVAQIGTVALALILGRPLGADEYPDRIGALLERAWAVTATGGVQPLLAALRSWLARALQLDPRQSFESAIDARAELDRALGASEYVAPLAALETFMAEYERSARPGERAARSVDTRPNASDIENVVSVPDVPKTPEAPNATMATTPPTVVDVPRVPEVARVPHVPRVPDVGKVPTPIEDVPQVPKAATVAVARPPITATINDDEVHMKATPWWRRKLTAAAAALVMLGVFGFAGRWYLLTSAVAEAPGKLVVNSNPSGAPVVIDGQRRGVTPITVDLPPGSHVLNVLTQGDPRTIPVAITAGSTVSHFIELPAPVAHTGHLQIRSEPSGARVTVDGEVRGVTPLTVQDLTPGAHTVVLANDVGTVTQDVRIDAGATASLVVPMSAPQGVPVSGWIAVNTPVDVQVFENNRLLGSSRSDRIMVSVGRHELEVVNEQLGYRAPRVVNVSPGQVSPVRLEWPVGSVALNAQPWAEVWVDGERVGETPIGNFALPIGPHEVVFRHPQLGERVVRTTVTLTAPTRLSVDLRKP